MEEPITFPLIHPEIMAPLDRLFVPPTVPENNFDKIDFFRQREQTLKEYDATFKQLLNLKQYPAVIILFKSILRRRITDLGLTSHHLSYIYYTALAYFNLGDYEHAAAMISMLLAFNPRNVDILIFLANIFIKQQAFEKARELLAAMKKLNVTNAAQKAQIRNFDNALNQLIIR